MDYNDFLKADQWALFREVIFNHYDGRCQYCGDPGSDVHHHTYHHGLFNPRTVTLLCRPCHEIHLGRQPSHIPDDHPWKSKLVRIAEIARALGMDWALKDGKSPASVDSRDRADSR
ncbi:MAG: HNH endonuclease [Planctomycetaceae bacterium]|nr:HNH endonuclease [Planctomycetaceae bacterium]